MTSGILEYLFGKQYTDWVQDNKNITATRQKRKTGFRKMRSFTDLF